MTAPLPLFPSSQARKGLSPSQNARLHESIASVLQTMLDIPTERLNVPATRAFIASYAKATAQDILEALVWDQSKSYQLTKHERLIRLRTLQLVERSATIHGVMSLEIIADVAIAYAQRNASRVRNVWASCLRSQPTLLDSVRSDMVPSFNILLSPEQIAQAGLYSARKSVLCLSCMIHAAPPEVLSAFSKDKAFMLALASAYDLGLLAMARTYGGLQHHQGPSSAADEWEIIWMETKTSLLDVFHILVRHILEAVGSQSSGPGLNSECDTAFEIFSALANTSESSVPASERVPFYNMSLVADYQQTYDMSKTLNAALRRADAARMDALDSQLHSLTGAVGKGPGALKLIIRSEGLHATQASNPAAPPSNSVVVTSQPVVANPQLEEQISQVQELLPDYSTSYIRALLVHPDYPFRGNPERVIEALLEGRAPPPDDVAHSVAETAAIAPVQVVTSSIERRNIFDDELVDISNLQIGKKSDDWSSDDLRQNREAIERMKADILRRVEEMDEEDRGSEVSDSELGIHRNKALDIAYEEELDEEDRVHVAGDGSAESDNDEGDDDVASEVLTRKPAPETVLELTYLRDPKLFDRDGKTRRDNARTELKKQTGWGDEQIEGWKIMFERQPQAQRDKILQKHEFRGNRPLDGAPEGSGSGANHTHGGSGTRGGAGRGGGGGGGRGRGGRGRGGGGGDDRAWKDKNKSSQANHNRKRGHDKKMARAGPPAM